jgi:hypothetical protein
MISNTYPKPSAPLSFRTNSAMSKAKNEDMNDNGSWPPCQFILLEVLGTRLIYKEDRYDSEQHKRLALSSSFGRLLSLSTSL